MRAVAIVISLVFSGAAIWYNFAAVPAGDASWQNLLVTLGFILFWLLFTKGSRRSIGLRIYSSLFWNLMIIVTLLDLVGLATTVTGFLLAPFNGFFWVIKSYIIVTLIILLLSVFFSVKALRKIPLPKSADEDDIEKNNQQARRPKKRR
ncbi:MAG: hypothetical protein ACOX05_01510 [Bacillota bacterium]|jgi:hypothetical protein